MTAKRRKFWGWGYEDEGPSKDHQAAIGALLAARFGIDVGEPIPEPQIGEIELRAPRLQAPATLAPLLSADAEDRAGHTYGKSFRDIVRGFRRDFSSAPDLVAHPRNEADIVQLLDWCTNERIAAIPYGGGSSVVGGVEARGLDDYAGAVSIDLGGLGRVLEVLVAEDDPVNRQLIVRMLEVIGHRATVAKNGREALELYAPGRFDVGLFDVNMPEMDGRTLTSRVRAAEEDAHGPRLYVYALTASVMPDEVAACLAAGMDSVLTKPILVDALEGALAQVPARPN